MESIVRLSRPGDEESLKKIWRAAFGDADVYINGFFERAYLPGSAVVAEEGGKVVSCAYLLRLGALISPDGAETECTATYAFGTLPESRGRGYGARVANAAIERSFDVGAPVSTICPAEDSLFGYYAERTGYVDFFYCLEREYEAAALPASDGGEVRRVSAGEYSAARERLLEGRTHVRLSPRLAAYQDYLCGESGGLFAGDGFCAAAERGDGFMFVKELLCEPERREECLARLNGVLRAERYFVRSPASAGEGRRFAMARPETEKLPAGGPPPWYGFAFD